MTTTATRPAWSRLGGGGILAAALLLFSATILEYFYWVPAGGDSPALLVAILVTFGLSILLYLLCVFPLAFGSTGSNGIVGRSVVGKIALLAFGIGFAALQTTYLMNTYITGGDAGAVSPVLAAVQYLGVLVAAIIIARVGIATGAARWALLVGAVVSAVCQVVVQTAVSYEVVTIAYSVSTIVQAAVGVTYLIAGKKTV
jgi:hypothetical protein